MTLAAIILTKNEERDLPACLESLSGLASRIYVVDSGSVDRTVEIAKEYGATVLFHEFVNHSSQFNWALEHLSLEAEWILRIDADERLTEDLKRNLRERVPGLADGVTGLQFPLRIHFLGRAIRWGDSYPVWLVRMWRRGKGQCAGTWMDEHIVLSEGRVERIPGDLIHEIPKTLTEWISKHNWYADRECKDIVDGANSASGAVAGEARRRRWMKQRVYLRLPLFVRAFLYWWYRYFLKLGFLDGKEGLIYHFLHAFWYRFLVDAKLYEMRKGWG